MFRLGCQVYSIIEAIFSKSGSFGRGRVAEPGRGIAAAPRLVPAQHVVAPIFIGVLAEAEYTDRMAAD
jgi:hypothetical protein